MQKQSQIIIISSIFKTNRALGNGGVICLAGGTMLWRNSLFANSFAGVTGGVLFSTQQAVVNISKSFCLKNKAGNIGGVLVVQMHSKVLIADTKIKQNSAYKMWSFGDMLQLYS